MPYPEASNVAARLRLYRQQTKRKPCAIADDLGVSRAALYRYERGEILKLETVHQVARLIGLTFASVIAPLNRRERLEALGASEDDVRVLLDEQEAA